jgi:hypothetical protein
MTLVIDMAPEMEGRLRDKAAREGLSPEEYAARAVEERLERVGSRDVPRPARAASGLLNEMEWRVSPDTWGRYRALIGKRDDGSLTAEEQGELIGLCDHIEVANARRIGALVELAALRRTSLDGLMWELGIPQQTYE